MDDIVTFLAILALIVAWLVCMGCIIFDLGYSKGCREGEKRVDRLLFGDENEVPDEY